MEAEKEEDSVGTLQYLLATDSGQLQVFQDSTLMWAATLPHPPTDISVATFQSVALSNCVDNIHILWKHKYSNWCILMVNAI